VEKKKKKEKEREQAALVKKKRKKKKGENSGAVLLGLEPQHWSSASGGLHSENQAAVQLFLLL
jgi:ribosome assembly protein YihI (activator of Der GTPase)